MYPSEAKELFHRKGCKFTYVGVDQTRRRPLRGAVHPLVLLHPSSRCDDYFRKTSTLQALFVAIQDTRDTHACSAQGDSRGDSRIARIQIPYTTKPRRIPSGSFVTELSLPRPRCASTAPRWSPRPRRRGRGYTLPRCLPRRDPRRRRGCLLPRGCPRPPRIARR